MRAQRCRKCRLEMVEKEGEWVRRFVCPRCGLSRFVGPVLFVCEAEGFNIMPDDVDFTVSPSSRGEKSFLECPFCSRHLLFKVVREGDGALGLRTRWGRVPKFHYLEKAVQCWECGLLMEPVELEEAGIESPVSVVFACERCGAERKITYPRIIEEIH